MAFVTGLLLIDAPASALNNQGTIPGRLFENTVAVKTIRTKEGTYPYVSAQAFRYWLRATLEQDKHEWKAAPIYREEKIEYTDGNPIKYWDDDLFGYMRAPGTQPGAKQARQNDQEYSKFTQLDIKDNKERAITRAAPFRVSTLVSIAPVNIVEDWENASRYNGDKFDGNPVPYSSQFYRATLKGLFSLNLNAAGTFWYRQKTGFRNLDNVRVEEAKQAGLQEVAGQKAYRLPFEQRLQRITTLFEGMATLDGGAKQTLHYTDVTPPFVIMTVTRGGNHIFGHIVGASGRGLPELNIDALKEAMEVFKDEILSEVYVGWVRGYLDEERAKLETIAKESPEFHLNISHPREAFKSLVKDLREDKNKTWLD